MRVFLAALAATIGLLAGTAAAAEAQVPPAQRVLQQALAKSMARIGSASGAYVVDLDTGQTLFAVAPTTGRLPASLEKIYTTSTALLRLGPTQTFTTSVLGTGSASPTGVWKGTLYLRGGGDPTFGSAGFDRAWYRTGATLHTLIGALLGSTGITALQGRVVGDASYFDSLRGTPATGYGRSFDVEGELSALDYNRGFLDLHGTAFQSRPPLFAAQQLAAGLRVAGVKLGRSRTSTGRAPASARVLASVQSPPISTLIGLTNTPSDNYLAEMLLKDIGAKLGGAGTTPAGAAVVRAELLSEFGISPVLNDGSGLSRADSTSPHDVVTVLESMATNPAFVDSLAVGGETGTLQHEMQDTVAAGNCRGKTGTLSDVANLAGYCQALDGDTLAFAFMANRIGSPDYVHRVEAGMAVALAGYSG
jgi:serine-type D-Ala-D-Ala carboxypeptidase/endopeptidase (penicillin-binding protein 4)